MNEKRKILFSAIYIFYSGLYSILCFYYLKRYFLFLIAISKTNITIFSLNKIKLLLRTLSHINKIIQQKLLNNYSWLRYVLDIQR